MEKTKYILVATKMGKKQYLQPGNFWSVYKDGALQFPTQRDAKEMKDFNNYAAKIAKLSSQDTGK